MQFSARLAWQISVLGLLTVGCNQNPYLTTQPSPVWQQQQQPQPSPPYEAQLQDLDRRATSLDADNRDLHTQVAKAQQQNRLLEDQNSLLRKRLTETTNLYQESQLANEKAEEKIRAVQASTRRRGGATITANNSVRNSLQLADIPGFAVRQDGDVVRVEVPTERLFHAHTAQLLPSANYLLDQLANAITRHYPKQMIGIEGHTDSSPNDATGSHQLAASQAVAVLLTLTRRNRIPSNQLFVVAHGSNHPRVSNATSSGRTKNRRIELVVYPDPADQS